MATLNPKNPYKGRNDTPAGYLPHALAVRHKLTVNTASDNSYVKRYSRGNRKIKALFTAVKAYRLFVHGVMEKRLPAPLRYGVHYLIEPMSRSSGGSNYEGKPVEQTSASAPAVA